MIGGNLENDAAALSGRTSRPSAAKNPCRHTGGKPGHGRRIRWSRRSLPHWKVAPSGAGVTLSAVTVDGQPSGRPFGARHGVERTRRSRPGSGGDPPPLLRHPMRPARDTLTRCSSRPRLVRCRPGGGTFSYSSGARLMMLFFRPASALTLRRSHATLAKSLANGCGDVQAHSDCQPR